MIGVFRRDKRVTAILIFAVALFVASTAWNVGTRINTQTKTSASLSDLIGAVEETCHREAKRNQQIKVRGEAEKALLVVFLGLARKAVAEGEDPTGVSERFVKRFAPLTARIEIIPLPSCHRQAEELRDQLPPG